MVKLLKYIISGMVSMVALNYLIDLFGICVLIGFVIGVILYIADDCATFYNENKEKYE